MSRNTFVIAETEMPSSYDPLEADYSNNLHASQMLHRTILDIGNDNRLHSTILSAFSYDSTTFEIQFQVNENAKFNDGTNVTAEDVELTIKRMIARRPTFPILRHIMGVEDWVHQSSPLKKQLNGILVEGNRLRIRLNQNVHNPLYRFALPLFGVIKADCIDLAKNRLTENCTTSGFYRVSGSDANTLTFVLNANIAASELDLPEEIQVKYLDASLSEEDLQRMNDGTYIILSQDYDLEINDQQSSISTFNKIEQPNSRFSAFLLNPNSLAFSTAECRRVFRDALKEALWEEISPLSQKESSIFSRILPGFLSTSDLDARIPQLTNKQISTCKQDLKGRPIKWMSTTSNNSKAFESALRLAAEKLEMKLEIFPDPSRENMFERFVNGGLDILLGGSGFWAFDPVGDIQMLFTKGLHKPLHFVTSDEDLQQLLRGLEFEENPKNRLERINQYLYEKALFNVFGHSKRLYLVRGPSASPTIPVAITPPAPWQMFHGSKK